MRNHSRAAFVYVGFVFLGLQRFNPDVSERDGIQVVLKKQGTFSEFLIGDAAGSGGVEFDVVLDADAVLEDGGAGIFLYGSVLVESGGAEVYVVGLPLERGLAGICERGINGIDRAAVAEVRILYAVGVENLQFICAVDINAAVALSLTGFVGHIGFAPFNVNVSIAVFYGGYDVGYKIFGGAVHGENSVFDSPYYGRAVAFGPHIGGGAVEKYNFSHADISFHEIICV